MRPVNDNEVIEALDKRMAGYGNGERTARELGVDSAYLRSIRSGNQAISLKVANKLGYQLRWVRTVKK